MVSRRKILSRSRDDLNMEAPPDEEEDIWYNKDKLYKVGGPLVSHNYVLHCIVLIRSNCKLMI